MKKKRICVFLERWESGGIESVISGLLLHLDADLYEADIVAESVGDSVFTERLSERGIGIIELSGRLRSGRNYSLFEKLIREREYDILHLNVFHGVALKYARIAERAGIKVRIAHAHGAGLRPSATRWMKLLLHRAARRGYASALTARLACSADAGKFLFGTAPFKVIGNGVDTDKFSFNPEVRSSARERLGVSGALLGVVGRLSTEKNQEFAIRVFSEFHKRHATARLVITGEGDTAEALRRLADELGLSDSVIFLGAQRQVEQLMLAIDLLLFPSISEGFGIVAVEAAVSGLPVLASTGVPECVAVNERTVRLPLDAGAAAWADKAEELLSKYSERGDMSADVVAAGYAASDTAAAIMKYYDGGEDNE